MENQLEVLERKEKNPQLQFAEVNFCAIDTWLEPYISWVVEVTKVTRRSVYFKQHDWNESKIRIYRESKRLFDLL